MRFIIGMIVFWICIISLKMLLENKFKIDKKFSFAMSFTTIGIIEFILGILNIMKLGTLIIVILLIIYLGYLLYSKKIKSKDLMSFIKKPENIICLLIFIYITIIGYNMHLTHYDNFSHWGIIVKSMFITNRLPNFENTYILFKGYQPGSACFIYFFGLLAGKKEGCMIIAQNYLIFAYFTVLFNYITGKNKILKILVLISFYIFIMTTSLIRFNNLLVDSLLAVMFIVGLLIAYNYRKNIKKAFIYTLPIVVYLFIVKNTGLILSGFIYLYLLFYSLKNKEIKKGVKYTIVAGIILIITLLIWQGHVSMVYGHYALSSKHSLSAQNLYKSLKTLGITNMIKFIKLYTIHFISLKDNAPFIYILGINLLSLIYLIMNKNKKIVLKFILTINMMYVIYYVILGFMYIFSMPWEEAKVFAGYERYMMTIIDTIVGITIIYIFSNKEKIKNTGIFLFSIVILLLIPVYYNRTSIDALLGTDGYKLSKVEKFDKIINYIPTDREKYYIYSPSAKKDYGYTYHLSIYKLLKDDVTVISEKKQIEDVEKNSYIVLLDELEDKNLFGENYSNINKYVLEKRM